MRIVEEFAIGDYVQTTEGMDIFFLNNQGSSIGVRYVPPNTYGIIKVVEENPARMLVELLDTDLSHDYSLEYYFPQHLKLIDGVNKNAVH